MNDSVIFYKFGNLVFSVDAPKGLKHSAQLESFRSCGEAVADFCIKVNLLPTVPEGEKSYPPPVKREGSVITISLHEDDVGKLSPANLFSLADAPFLFIEKNAFILHSSFIIYKGSAVLFSAPSGVGKSTHASFWEKTKGAEIINGDRALIYKKDGEYFVSGVYTAGSSGISKNKTAPLRAIVLLEQGDVNEVFDVSPREYIRRIVAESSYNADLPFHCAKITNIVIDLFSASEIFCYRCRNNPDSAEFLENYLWKETKRRC